MRCDYRLPNSKIFRDSFPTPLIDNGLDRLKEAKEYTTLDLSYVSSCSVYESKKHIFRRKSSLIVSRWALYLEDFNYSIEYRSGSKMPHVNSLSRNSCLILEDLLSHRMKLAQLDDDWVRKKRTILKYNKYEDFYMKNEILYKYVDRELLLSPRKWKVKYFELLTIKPTFLLRKHKQQLKKCFSCRSYPLK